MRNLLTNQIKKGIQKEYHARFFVVALSLLSVAFFMGTIFLIPVYLLADLRKDATEAQSKLVLDSIKQQESQISSETLHRTQEQLNIFSSIQSETSLSDYLREIIGHKPSGIDIEVFFYKVEEGVENSFTLSGVANTRDDLLLFERGLKSEPNFTSVVLPVSNLAQDKNISFSLIVKETF